MTLSFLAVIAEEERSCPSEAGRGERYCREDKMCRSASARLGMNATHRSRPGFRLTSERVTDQTGHSKARTLSSALEERRPVI